MDEERLNKHIKEVYENTGKPLKFIQNMAKTANKLTDPKKQIDKSILDNKIKFKFKQIDEHYQKEINRKQRVFGFANVLILSYFRTLLKTKTKDEILYNITIFCMNFATQNHLEGIDIDLIEKSARSAIMLLSNQKEILSKSIEKNQKINI